MTPTPTRAYTSPPLPPQIPPNAPTPTLPHLLPPMPPPPYPPLQVTEADFDASATDTLQKLDRRSALEMLEGLAGAGLSAAADPAARRAIVSIAMAKYARRNTNSGPELDPKVGVWVGGGVWGGEGGAEAGAGAGAGGWLSRTPRCFFAGVFGVWRVIQGPWGVGQGPELGHLVVVAG